MATVTISWGTTPQTFPPGTVAGNFNVTITGGPLTTPLTSSVAASPAVFAGVSDNQGQPPYVVTVQRVDSAGNSLGAAATATFDVVVPPDVVVDIPTGVTVTVV